MFIKCAQCGYLTPDASATCKQCGGDPLTGAPSPVSDIQLRDVGIALRKPPLPGTQ